MSDTNTLPHPNVGRSRAFNFICDGCGRRLEREEIRVKSVIFKRIGSAGKWIRTRTVAWVCEGCMKSDPDYNRPKSITSPGIKKAAGNAKPDEIQYEIEGEEREGERIVPSVHGDWEKPVPPVPSG